MIGGKRLRVTPKHISVYICEYHDEALRCLHHAIRRKRVPFENLTMVHLDAHPDLSTSVTMPADIVFDDPQELYFNLRSDSGGIASWILPAVYGGHFRCVWWVRPSWALQIADGRYDVAVGKAQRTSGAERAAASHVPREQDKAEETIHISCSEPYFVEDEIYCSPKDLINAKPLQLLVSELPYQHNVTWFAEAVPEQSKEERNGNGSDSAIGFVMRRGSAWTLDVCLDYFACGNPFLKHVRKHIAAAFAAIQNAATFRQGSVTDVPSFHAARDEFQKAYGQVLQAGESPDTSQRDKAIEALGSFLPEESRAILLEDLRKSVEEAHEVELSELVEAADMVTLPVHATEKAELQEKLEAFESFLERLCSLNAFGGKPSAVTIARSVVDGFCPMRWVCFLENSILDILRRQLGGIDIVYSDELDSIENP